MQDPQEFLNTLKTELFVDEVYVFTPKGEIKVLPRGATPIDFAYNIHAEIGHHMTGCKINSKMMPIITALHNGDIVEIITSDQSKGPSRDWLKFIKSTSAKNKILAYFKKTQRVENIEKGRIAIEKEIKRIGIPFSKFFKNEYVQVALDRYKYNTVEDMYAAVGFGAITASKVIAKILEVYKKDNQDEFLEKKLEELANEKTYRSNASNVGIVVKGIDNCLVRLSKCCNPVPGDEIVGFVTRGRGVSVHRKDCVNVKDLISQEDRMIDVYWFNEADASYTVEIEILANERNNLLADLIKQVSLVKVRLLGVNSKNVVSSLRKVEGVFEVNRKK